MKPYNLENDPKINSGFKVPDNYFDNFSEKLMSKIPNQEIKVISIFSKTKTWIFAVAAILIVGISIPVLNNYLIKSSSIENLDLENYITENQSINDHDIAELLTQNDINKIKIDLKIEDQLIEKELSENENLEEYLIN